MMQNVSVFAAKRNHFWLPLRRFMCPQLHSKRSSQKGLQLLNKKSLSQCVAPYMSESKVWNSHRKISNFQKFRTREYASLRKYYGSDEEELATLSDGEIDTEDLTNLNIDPQEDIRVRLYPDSSDPILKHLSQAGSVQDIFTVVEKYGSVLSAKQASQAVVTLWDLQKVCGKYGVDFPNLTHVELNDFFKSIINHKTFLRLLSHLQDIAEDLEGNAVSCLLLYLYRLGVKNTSPLIQRLVLLSIENVESYDFIALSRLSVYLRNQGLSAYYLQSKVVSVIASRLKNVSTPEELKLATICLNSASRLLPNSLFDDYKMLLNKLLIEGKLEDCEPRVLLKCLRFLNQSEWINKPTDLQRDVLLSLSKQIHTLNSKELISVHGFFRVVKEPWEIQSQIQEHAKSMIEKTRSPTRKLKLLLCLAPFTTLEYRAQFEELIVENLEEENLYEYINVIFQCLRSLKISNVKLCHAFWNKAFAAVEKEIQNFDEPFLGFEEVMRRRVYQHYMYFNNNLGGTYRNFYLESNLSELFINDLRGPCGLFPYKVSRLSAFLIAYCRANGIPDDIEDKILSSSSQFSLIDIVNLSRGIQISLAFKHQRLRRSYTEQIARICHVLNSRTEKHLQKVQSLSEVNSLMRAYLNRGGSPRTFLFDALVQQHISFMGELNSRILRDISTDFLHASYLAPEVLENISQYIIDNAEYLLGETVARFINCIYFLGYHPKSSEKLFSACVNVLERDWRKLSGLGCMEVAISLCLYGHLPTTVIQSIFRISFLDHLDEEITTCYSKGSYPHRVRHSLMELNRSVCIDYPEEKVPWFHEKYCEELLETVAVPSSAFHVEVHQALSKLVGGQNVVRANAKTPYYYLIDFEFMLDTENKPVPLSEYTRSHITSNKKDTFMENKPGFRRIAVLIRNEDSYLVNARQLKGRHQMECRHLEMLGYEVLEVPHFMWYSMAHATMEDRIQYLKTLIHS